jgi:hypothetical protein
MIMLQELVTFSVFQDVSRSFQRYSLILRQALTSPSTLIVNGSTAIESLTQAFMTLHLNATLEGLGSKLLNYANVTVLPTTGVSNDLAGSVVSIQNPFSAPLRITNIQANVTSNGFFVGTITTDTDFTSQGHVGTTSPSLDL